MFCLFVIPSLIIMLATIFFQHGMFFKLQCYTAIQYLVLSTHSWEMRFPMLTQNKTFHYFCWSNKFYKNFFETLTIKYSLCYCILLFKRASMLVKILERFFFNDWASRETKSDYIECTSKTMNNYWTIILSQENDQICTAENPKHDKNISENSLVCQQKYRKESWLLLHYRSSPWITNQN